MIYDFGQRLRELRETKNLSQSQVARRLSLTRASISGYENDLAIPSVEVLYKFALLFGVTTDYLLGLDNRKAIVIDGLTKRQEDIIHDIVHTLLVEFRGKN
jgi:transcriptional regulator with XRE-family HTH domain